MNQEREEIPWYHEGLGFSCTGCGNCCTGSPGAVWVEDEELQQIAKFRDVSIGEIRLLHTRIVRGQLSLTEYPNGDCTFFDPQKRSCTIYPVRPTQCRTWPFWKSHVADEESWQRVCQVCPGAGNGTVVPAEDIEIMINQTNL